MNIVGSPTIFSCTSIDLWNYSIYCKNFWKNSNCYANFTYRSQYQVRLDEKCAWHNILRKTQCILQRKTFICQSKRSYFFTSEGANNTDFSYTVTQQRHSIFQMVQELVQYFVTSPYGVWLSVYEHLLKTNLNPVIIHTFCQKPKKNPIIFQKKPSLFSKKNHIIFIIN